MTAHTVLKINSSARFDGSISRDLTDRLADNLTDPDTRVLDRDLAMSPVPQIDERWVGANFTVPEERSDDHKQALAFSDALVSELQAAETIVIGMPIYNFGVPAALRAWIDHIARARLTFRYTENGPEGLLTGKTAYLVVASGGTPIGSEIDFATGYMKHALNFVGISDVHVIDAGQWMSRSDEAKQDVFDQVDQIKRPAVAA